MSICKHEALVTVSIEYLLSDYKNLDFYYEVDTCTNTYKIIFTYKLVLLLDAI